MGRIIANKVRGMNWMAKISLILIFTLVFSTFMYQGLWKPKQAQAAVAVLQAFPNTPTITAAAITASGSFTVSAGANRLLLVAVEADSGGTNAGSFTVTYGGQTLTQSVVSDVTQRRISWLGYLNETQIAAASGTTLAVTASPLVNTTPAIRVYASTYTGVNQTTPINATYSIYNNNTTANFTYSLAVQAGGYGVFAITANNATSPTITVDTGYTVTSVSAASPNTNYSICGSKAYAAASNANPTITYPATVRGGIAAATINPSAGDVTPPTVTFDLQAGSDAGDSNTDNLTNAATLVFDAIFSEAITGFAAGDLSNTGTATGCSFAVGAPTGNTYPVTVTTCSAGTVIVRMAASGVTDIALNPIAQTDGPTITRDATAPTVTINQAGGQADPTSTSPINFTVVFSESTTTFATGDVTITGTAGGTKTATVTGSGTTYNVAVTGMTTAGTVIANIGAGVATDAAGNGNTASTSTDNTVTWNGADVTPPTVTFDLQAGSDAGDSNTDNLTNAATLVFDAIFSEAITGFAAGDLSNTGTATGCSFAVGAPTGNTYPVTVTTCSAGTVIVRMAASGVTDIALNPIAQTDGPTITRDATAPTVTINQAGGQADPTSTSPINFTVVFSESTTTFATGDVTITGTAGGTKTATVTGSGTTYNVAVTGMTTTGTVIADIAAGVATDAAGNNNTASTSTDKTVQWNAAACTRNAPTVSLAPTTGTISVDSGTVVYTLSITNNDTAACANETFSTLAKSDSNTTNFDASTLSATSVVVAPGATNTTVTLTAHAKAGQTAGTNTSFVSVPSTNHTTVNTNNVTTTLNVVANDPLLHNSLSTGSTKWNGSGGWGIVGGRYGEFVCETCHSKSTTNIKRIDTAITAPSSPTLNFPGGGTVAFTDARNGSSDFGDDSTGHATSTKVCEVCHTYDGTKANGVKFHAYNMSTSPAGDRTHNNQTNCTTCHPHNVGFKVAAGACDSCHGNPPTAADPRPAIVVGAHVKHLALPSADCATCHTGGMIAAYVGNSTTDINFNYLSTTTGTFDGRVGVTYSVGNTNGGTTQCSTVYCHSSGQSDSGALPTPVYATTPSWAGAIACNGCHATTTRTTGSHTDHLTQDTNCGNCHTGATAATYAFGTTHLNKLIDVAAGVGYSSTSTPGNGYGTCSTASCHADPYATTGSVTTPTWGNNIGCGACHTGGGALTTVGPATGSHVAHNNPTCTDCHNAGTTATNPPDTGHRDGNIDVNNGYPANVTKHAAGSGYSTCSTASCHGNVYGSGSAVTPTWGTAATCDACHSVAIAASGPATGSHAAHNQTNCALCHAGATNNTTVPTLNHADGDIDVINGYPANVTKHAAGSGYSTCASASGCHNNGTGVATGVVVATTTPTWGTSSACNICHGVGGPTTGGPNYANLKRVPITQSGATWTTPANALAEDAAFATYAGTAQGTLILTTFGYTATEVADTDTITGITVVVKGWSASATTPGNQLNIQLTQNGTAGVGTAKAISLPGTTSAANAEVVATTTPTDLWGATWTPAQIRATTFGVILKDNDTANSQLNVDMVKVIVHTDKSRKMNSHANHSSQTCDTCHSTVVNATPAIISTTLHNNDAYNLLAKSGVTFTYTYNAASSSCSTVSCHGGTARWGASDMNCISCHSSPQTGTHGTPRDAVVGEFGLAYGHKKTGRGAVTPGDCIVCHLEGKWSGTVGSSSIVTSNYHMDGNIDLRDPDALGGEVAITNMTGGAFTFTKFATAYTAGSRTSTGHTSNNVDNVITQKFCLACHDSNGAQNSTARSNASSTNAMPFGGVALGATYTAINGAIGTQGLIDVKSQFATTNTSVHPVLGPRTSDYPVNTRLAVPYDNIGTTRTAGGHVVAPSVVMNCFDCHNTVGRLTTRTVAAHGNAVTIMAPIYTNANATATTMLCTICHVGYNAAPGTTSQHGAGSAGASSWNSVSATTICHNCHSSATTSPARPIRAQDYHGTSTLAGGALWTWGGSGTPNPAPPVGGSKIYAFIRNTNNFFGHHPYRGVGEWTTGSATCQGGTGRCAGNNGTQTYTPGGTY